MVQTCTLHLLYPSVSSCITGDNPRIVEEEKDARARRLERKKRLKAMFDADYDDVDGGSKHYDELKKEVDQQTMVSAEMIATTRRH